MTWLAFLRSKQNSEYEFLRGLRHLEEVCVCCQHSHCSNLQRPPLLLGGIQLMPWGPVLTVHMDTLPAPPGRNCATPSTCEQPQGDLRVATPSRCPARPGRRQSPHQPGGSQGLAVTEASQGVAGQECIKQHKGPRRPSISSETPNPCMTAQCVEGPFPQQQGQPLHQEHQWASSATSLVNFTVWVS